MKSLRITAAIALAACLFVNTNSFGAPTNQFRSNNASMNWSTAGDWQRFDDAGAGSWVTSTVEPVEGGVVTIQDNHTVAVTTQTAILSSLTIENQPDAVLSLRASGILVIDGTLTINANSVFEFNDQGDSDPNRPILKAINSLTISGNIQTVSGADKGGIIQAPTATHYIRLASGTISSQYGPVSITGEFENDGTVTANGGTDGFDVTFTGILRNGSAGLFQVTAANSEMIFNHDVTGGNPSLTGADFNVAAGIMHFPKSLTTSGGFQLTGGRVKVDSTRFFSATGYY